MRKQNELLKLIFLTTLSLLPLVFCTPVVAVDDVPLADVNKGSSVPGQFQDKIWVGMSTDKLVENMQKANVIPPGLTCVSYLTVQPLNTALTREPGINVAPPAKGGNAIKMNIVKYGQDGIILLVLEDGAVEFETALNGAPAGLSPMAKKMQLWAYLTHTPELKLGQEMWFYPINYTYFIGVVVDKRDSNGDIMYNTGGTVTDIVACSLEPLKRQLQKDGTYKSIPGLQPILTEEDSKIEVRVASTASGIGLGSTTEEIIRKWGMPATLVPFANYTEKGSYTPNIIGLLTTGIEFRTAKVSGAAALPLGQKDSGIDPVILTDGKIRPGSYPEVIKAGFSKNFVMVYTGLDGDPDNSIELFILDNVVIRVHYGQGVVAIPTLRDKPIVTIQNYNEAFFRVQAENDRRKKEAEEKARAAAEKAAAAGPGGAGGPGGPGGIGGPGVIIGPDGLPIYPFTPVPPETIF